jgi:ubiquinone/menaquinone biosynthesis C-methylase UbiE
MKEQEKVEFDKFSEEGYEKLLDDPLRDSLGGSIEFFHLEKMNLMKDLLLKNSEANLHLDIGCGDGTLLGILQKAFQGCFLGVDTSREMMKDKSIHNLVCYDGFRFPFQDNTFKSLSVACVFHHVPPENRKNLLKEMHRVLVDGGEAYIFEHNPYNPVTRLIVARAPVDADAILLTTSEFKTLSQDIFKGYQNEYYLFFPQKIAPLFSFAKPILKHVPFGGQYCVKLIK